VFGRPGAVGGLMGCERRASSSEHGRSGTGDTAAGDALWTTHPEDGLGASRARSDTPTTAAHRVSGQLANQRPMGADSEDSR
jgi:hypothetical protein